MLHARTASLRLDTLNLETATLPQTAASRLEQAVARARDKLLSLQHEEGYWVFELEADCTIPSEYILMMHYMDEIDEGLQVKIARYIRMRQNEDGSWPLYHGGAGDISCSVKAYYALKMTGDDIDSPHMKKAREWLLAQGGAAKANVFTRIMLAIFEQVPWRAAPFVPVEIMLIPRWFPFHLDKVSYWSRTVMVPLAILCSLKARARNPYDVHIRELFVTPPEEEKNYFDHVKTPLGKTILKLERIGFHLERFIPKRVRQKAIAKAQTWFEERLNGEDGLGGIFPAMVSAYEALELLGVSADDPRRVTAKRAIEKLLVFKDDHAYCQPCVSPVWDTALSVLALQEVNKTETGRKAKLASFKGLDWLASKQLKDEPGDWQVNCPPGTPGGGWAFQFGNSYYPDVDDTAVVAVALEQAKDPRYAENVERAAQWIAAMQSNNGGFGAFDRNNEFYYLNQIPFADHGALLDPPTADVSGRCAWFMALLTDRHPELKPALDRCMDYLFDEQETDGSWYGRWGTNYIYGIWSVMFALKEAGVSKDDPRVRKAVAWLKSVQRPDGGWGEGNWSYHDPATRGQFHTSMAFHTALALISLLTAGEGDSPEVRAGVDHLLRTQRVDGVWHDEDYNAPGFPRVFYLKYHGYDKFFPLWALASYRNALAATA
jgi:squalene-hopene/tetraprenyl-beta-curcumene cyclase